MPYRTKISSSPMTTHPCPACSRMTRTDGYCRTRTCPNRVPDAIVAPAREAALAEMRALLHTDKDSSDDQQ